MPTSSDLGKAEAVGLLEGLHPRRVLDVGPGAGRWHDELAPLFPGATWDAIEIWAPYVERFGLREKYDRVVIADVGYVDPVVLGHYDLAIFGDVLEHMAKERAVDSVYRLDWKVALLSVPMAGGEFEHQGPAEGNPFEEHLASWTAEEVAQTFPVVRQWTSAWIGVFVLSQ